MALIVTLDLFSGLPNPFWSVACDQAADLIQMIGAMATTATPAEPPGLGYRGVAVAANCPDLPRGAWHVFGGTVTFEGRTLVDTGRTLERWLVASGDGHVNAGILNAAREAIR